MLYGQITIASFPGIWWEVIIYSISSASQQLKSPKLSEYYLSEGPVTCYKLLGASLHRVPLCVTWINGWNQTVLATCIWLASQPQSCQWLTYAYCESYMIRERLFHTEQCIHSAQNGFIIPCRRVDKKNLRAPEANQPTNSMHWLAGPQPPCLYALLIYFEFLKYKAKITTWAKQADTPAMHELRWQGMCLRILSRHYESNVSFSL